MIRCALNIRYAPVRQRETVAWLIPDDDAESWLQELARWNVDWQSLRLRPLPRSKCDGSVGGVLVTLADRSTPQVSLRCQEYGRVAERLFLPINACWAPEVLEAEVVALLDHHETEYVFHPAVGLVAVGCEHLLRVADLLRIPSLTANRWDLARPGDTLISRLRSVEPLRTPTLTEVLQAGQDDIGTQDLTPGRSPQEKSERRQTQQRGVLARLRNAVRAAFRGGRSVPRASPSPPREVERLLRLLTQDPDEGLRYALPLAGSDQHRGVAEGTGGLTRRNIDFSLNTTSKSGAACSWIVSHDQYQSLHVRYRELANRELSLGRFRRAAYILAHLLGDWGGAAAALASGQHWREAAIVYRDRLKQVASAAECLEKAGLWTDAIVLYEQMKQYEKVGDLYTRSDLHEDAERAYRQAVEHCLRARDFIGAARLFEWKLRALHEALPCLAKGWPNSNQAAECLRGMFRILAALREHEDAARRVQLLAASSLSSDGVEKAVAVLAEISRDYPEHAIRHLASDQARVMAGRQMASSRTRPSAELLNSLAQLAPEDRLMRRDCARFARSRSMASPRTVAARSGRAVGLRQNWIFELPAGVVWHTAGVDDEACYFAGYEDERLAVARLPWGARLEELARVSWPVSAGLSGQPILLCPAPWHPAKTLLHVVGGVALSSASVKYRVTDAVPHERPIGAHRVFSPDTYGVARSPDGLVWIVSAKASSLALAAYSPDEQLMHSVDLPCSRDRAHPGEVVPVLAGSAHIVVACGGDLVCRKRGGGQDVIHLPSAVRALCAPPEECPRYCVVVCDHHVLVLWHASAEISRLEVLRDDVSDVVCGFTRAGQLVVVEHGRFEIYRQLGQNSQREGGGAAPVSAPIAVLTTPQPDQVLICSRMGVVSRAAIA